MTFVNLHVHSHFSLLDGLSQPNQIAQTCAELNQSACALTDHGSISGAVSFIKECKKHNIKPILGVEAYITEQNANIKTKDNIVSHQVILAKNLNGWYKLIQLVSKSNDEENFYYRPRIDLDILKNAGGDDLVSFSGHLGSTLHLRSSSMSDMENYVRIMQDIFGPNNFFLEIQLVNKDSSDMIRQAKRIRELSEYTKVPCIATGDAHYCKQDDAYDHRILLCSSLKLTMKDVKKQLRSNSCPLSEFFTSNVFHIPSEDYLIGCGNTPEEIHNTGLIADSCEFYDITGPPKLPKFSCPNNMDENSYLRELCKKGWYNKEKNWNKTIYGERVKQELAVIKKADLAGYFLIVQDYVNWAKNQGWLVGIGRGSVAGSLVAHLLNITHVDPIENDLIFERFYNAARAGSLPDIDMDFPKFKRPQVIQYLKDKYGHDKVCQMATFGRLQGRSAIKEVLRAHNVCDFETMNLITKNIPQEAEIADQLQDAGETSIIKWTLQNNSKDLSDWCTLENNEFYGEYSEYFAQAIRLEGTYKSQGKHAAGIVLSVEPLDKVCPMIRDKNSSEKIAGLGMEDLESMGHVKFDILGLVVLDKLMAVNDLLAHGRIL